MNNPLKEKLYLLLLMNVSEKIDINKKKALFSAGIPLWAEGKTEKVLISFMPRGKKAIAKKPILLSRLGEVFNDSFRILCQENSEYAMRSIARKVAFATSELYYNHV